MRPSIASGIGGIDEDTGDCLVALEALVNCFSQQTEDQKEMLANFMDPESSAKAQKLAEF